MKKKLLFMMVVVSGVLTTAFCQSTPLYMGYNYNPNISIMDTATFTETGTIAMTSDAGSVNGCYGLSLDAASGDMYILYQLSSGSGDNRNLGIIDLISGEITDIGTIGNMNDIGFVNGDLYATSGSYDGQSFYRVNKADASTTFLLDPSTDNESCALIHNYYNGNVYYLDEAHFTLIDLETNSETLTPGFPFFPEECNSIVMITEKTALVGNYSQLHLFNLETFTFTLVMSASNNIHGMAFGQYPLVVTISGPSTFCSTDPSILSTSETGGTYQWFLDGVIIDGATEATYVPSESGAYSCEVDGQLTKNNLFVTVIPAPEASYTATPNPVFLGDDPTGSVAFENTTLVGDEFFWDFDNGFTSMLENPIFPFAEAGEYDVLFVVTDTESGCLDSTTTTVVVTDNAGILGDEYLFTIARTLTSDYTIISYGGAEVDLTASLFDLNGKLINTVLITPEGNTKIDLSSLENGMYVIKINSSTESKATFRVTKQ